MNGQAAIIVVVLVSLIQLTSGFEFTDCTGGKTPSAKLDSISISSCPDTSADRCDFIKGTNVTMTTEFEPTRAFTEANIKISAKVGIIWETFDIPGPKNACGNYGFDCPVKVGEKYQMKITLPVSSLCVPMKLPVRYELTDEKTNPIVCFEFPAYLKRDS